MLKPTYDSWDEPPTNCEFFQKEMNQEKWWSYGNLSHEEGEYHGDLTINNGI